MLTKDEYYDHIRTRHVFVCVARELDAPESTSVTALASASAAAAAHTLHAHACQTRARVQRAIIAVDYNLYKYEKCTALAHVATPCTGNKQPVARAHRTLTPWKLL